MSSLRTTLRTAEQAFDHAMDTMAPHLGRFSTASAVLIVAGKGGVGKTTVAAALATAAARNGASTLLVEIDGKRQLADLFGLPRLGYEPVRIDYGASGAPLWVRTITPDRALTDYLAHRGLYRALKRVQGDRVLDALASSTPGVKDLLVLGKIKQLERSDEFDLIVVDAPASGHALTLVRSAEGVLDSVDSGPIREQAIEVAEMLADPDRCQVVLVTLAEETPITELIETAFQLEDEIGVALGPIVVNALRPDAPALPTGADLAVLDTDVAGSLCASVTFELERMALRDEQLGRLTDQLPLPRIQLPRVDTTPFGLPELEELIEELTPAIEVFTARRTSAAHDGTEQ